MSARFNRRSNNYSTSGNPRDRRNGRDSNSSKSRSPMNKFEIDNSDLRFNKDEKRSSKSQSHQKDNDSYSRKYSRNRDGLRYLSSENSRFSDSSRSRKENTRSEVKRNSRERIRVYQNKSNRRYLDNSNHQFDDHRIEKPKANDEEMQGLYQENEDSDLIWGKHATQAVLETGRPVHRIWCTAEIRSSPKFLQLLRDAKASGVLVEEVTWARLGQITSGGVHQGITLQKAAVDTLDLKGLIRGCSQMGESPLLVALDGLTDPHNLGAIVRSAEALGAHGMVLPQRRSAGLTGSVAKVAAGALEHLPVARVVNLNRSLEVLKDEGYTVIGLADEGDLTISEIDLEGPLVVVTGSEGKGISLMTRKHCDQLVRIPLRGVTTSLNASVATALLLYEVARRAWMKGISGQAPSPKLVRAKYSAAIESENTQ